MFERSSRRLRLASALLALVALGGCSSEPGPSAGTANTATKPATNAPAPVPGGMPGNLPQPMGMEDSIEGRVVAVLCIEKNPNMSADEMKACSESTFKGGGALAVLASDGTLYINDEVADVRRNNNQFEFFIGQEVTVQGQLIGDATRPKIGEVPVKQFRMKLVRRKKPAATNAAAGK